MARLFLSYSRDDEPFARQLAASLAQRGADVWIDVEDIPAGMKWSSAIQEGLDVADALIVIISPESMKSRNAEDEWQYFLDQGKIVIPILYQPAKVHFQLSRIQYIDFHRQTYDKALRQLRAELKRKGIPLQALPGDDGQTTGSIPVQNPLPVIAQDRRLVIGVTLGVVALVLGIIALRALFIPNPALSSAAQTSTAVVYINATASAAPTDSPNNPSVTPTLTLSVTPSRTPRPGAISPTDLALTDLAGVSLEETRIAQEETDQFLTENAPLFLTQEVMTLTAESYTDTATPNYRETAISRRTATSVAGTQYAAATGTQMALVSPTPSLTFTPIPNLTPSTLACGSAPPSRLNVGMRGSVVVSPPGEDRENLNVRPAPGVNSEPAVPLAEGTIFYIVGEAVCGDGLRWWRIQTPDNAVTGWSAEGQAPDDYFMVPVLP